MTISPAGVDRIKRYEALRLRVYYDQAGLPTVGYGHLLASYDAVDKKLVPVNQKAIEILKAGSINEVEALNLLIEDLEPAQKAVNSMVKVPLTQDQYDSLVSFAFNTGTHALYTSSLLSAINRRVGTGEIVSDFLKWTKIHDPVTRQLVESPGLKKRRIDEAKAWGS